MRSHNVRSSLFNWKDFKHQVCTKIHLFFSASKKYTLLYKSNSLRKNLNSSTLNYEINTNSRVEPAKTVKITYKKHNEKLRYVSFEYDLFQFIFEISGAPYKPVYNCLSSHPKFKLQ